MWYNKLYRMNYKRKIFLIIVISALAFIYAVVGLCKSIPTGMCLGEWGELGQVVGFYSIVLFLLSIIFFFLKENVFRSWVKFSKYYLPVDFIFDCFSSIRRLGE